MDYDDAELVGMKRKITTGCGNLHVQAFFTEDGKMREVFLSKGSTGGCNNFMIGLSRMISLALRNDIPLKDVLDQLKSTGACPSYASKHATGKASKGACCPMAVGYALIEMDKQMKKHETP